MGPGNRVSVGGGSRGVVDGGSYVGVSDPKNKKNMERTDE